MDVGLDFSFDFRRMMYVYILTNNSRNVFYTGVTNDLKRRVREHEKQRGLPQTFTGRYYCYKLVYYEEFESAVDAIARETEIKSWSRARKLELIKKRNPKMVFYRV